MTIPDVHGSVTIQMPAWNALYQIRDFAYHVIGSTGHGRVATPASRVRAPRQADLADRQAMARCTVEYASYWNEPGPFGTQLNGEHAFLNLAMVLVLRSRSPRGRYPGGLCRTCREAGTSRWNCPRRAPRTRVGVCRAELRRAGGRAGRDRTIRRDRLCRPPAVPFASLCTAMPGTTRA